MTAYLRPFTELIAATMFVAGTLLLNISFDEWRHMQPREAEMVVRSAHLEAGR